MQNPDSANHRTGHGRQVSFIMDKETKNKYTEWMKAWVDSKFGKMVYGHRMSTVEPVFANIGSNKGLKRFSLRGKAKSESVAIVLYDPQYREAGELWSFDQRKSKIRTNTGKQFAFSKRNAINE